MKQFLRGGVTAGLMFLANVLFATVPVWWTNQGVIDTNAVSNDYAPVNQGQVKNMASHAWQEFRHKLTNDCSAISNLVAGFSQTNNYFPANIGQLKTVALPFYDVLFVSGLTNGWPDGMTTGPYPWSDSTNSPQDFAMANIGQLKCLFSFSLDVDADGNGLPDWWELFYFGTTTGTATNEDAESDGLTNLEEYQAGLNPLNSDTDTNGVPDAIEVGIQGTTGADGLLILLPGRECRHVTESSLNLNDYGAYGAE